jgi:hypothetical protein
MSLELKDSYVMVAGFAQLPKGTPVFELQKTIGCILVIDTDTDIIVKATFTFLKELTNEFVGELLRGKSIENIDEIINEMENKFIIPPQKAAIQAVISAKKIYDERKNNQKK